MKLYDIPMEFALIEQTMELMLICADGEVTPEVEAKEAELKQFLSQSADKIEAAVKVIRNLEADAEACKEEADRLKARERSLVNQTDRLKSLISGAVDSAFNGKLKTPKFTIWNQESKPGMRVGLAPDADAIQCYNQMPGLFELPELSKTAIKISMEVGVEIPRWLVVEELPAKRSLRIR